MLSWTAFFDQLIYWAQWITTLVVFTLVAVAFLCFFIDKKITIKCAFVVIVLFIVAGILSDFGIQILAPEFYAFFGGSNG